MNNPEPYTGLPLLGVIGCTHLDITDDGLCVGCNLDINSDEFLDSLPELPATANMGDLVSIIKLAQATAELYLEFQSDNRDPDHPELFKLRQVGSQIVRLPDSIVWADILPPSYVTAKALGYRSSYDRWSEICKEYLDLLLE